MATYLILNLIFIALAIVLLRLKPRRPSKPWLIMFLGLLLLTLVFDNLLIYLGFVAYSPDKLLGLYLGLAPVEDFFYAVLAALMIPAVWYKLKEK